MEVNISSRRDSGMASASSHAVVRGQYPWRTSVIPRMVELIQDSSTPGTSRNRNARSSRSVVCVHWVQYVTSTATHAQL